MEGAQTERMTLFTFVQNISPAARTVFVSNIRTSLGTALLASYALWLAMQIIWTHERIKESPPEWTFAAKEASYTNATR